MCCSLPGRVLTLASRILISWESFSLPRALFEIPLGLPVWKTASCAALGVSVAEKAWLSPRGGAVLDITVGLVPIPPPQ